MPISNDWIFEALRTMAERGVSETTDRDVLVAKIQMLEAKVDWLRHRGERAERILALLRKPNEGVVRAANKSFYGVDKPNSLTWAIIAAVAGAEQEVGK